MRERLDTIVADLLTENYYVAERVARAAQQQAAHLQPPAPPTADHPLSGGVISQEWIDQTIDVENTKARLDKQRGVLLTLANEARGRANAIAAAQRVNILTALNKELRGLLDEVHEVSEQLGDADTASKAIAADIGPQWKRLTDLADDYDDLRQAQMFRVTADMQFNVRPNTAYPHEPHASDLYLRNLDELWPDWRNPNPGVIDLSKGRDRRLEPWPLDRAELMLWLVRSAAQPWMPTDAQLEQLRQDRIARANPLPPKVTGRPDKPVINEPLLTNER